MLLDAMEELGISKGYRGIQGNVAKLVSSAHMTT